jgi:hypothetical protein
MELSAGLRYATEKKATDGSAPIAFTPFAIDFQAVCGS